MSSVTKQLVVRAELDRIYLQRGRLLPADVLDDAAVPTSPLHHFFEWDDSEASRLYRLAQAAGLIRSVKIRVEREAAGITEELVVRAWVAARGTATDADVPEGYMPEAAVRQSPELREAVLRQMRREITAIHRRYRHLAEYWELVDELTAQRDKRAS